MPVHRARIRAYHVEHSSEAVNALGNCIFVNCLECIADSPECPSCVFSKCTDQVAACNAANCE